MKKTSLILPIFIVSFIGLGALLPQQVAYAADPKPNISNQAYQARYVSQTHPDPVVIEAGKTKTVTFKFKNTGSTTWRSLSQHPDGYGHVSAYTMEPRYRTSAFQGANWLSAKQTASISKDTKPGEIAELSIDFKAPTKPGEYKEEFYLAAENMSWMGSGYFYIQIKVVEAASTDTENKQEPEPKEEQKQEEKAPYQANLFGQSKKEVAGRGGEDIAMVLMYQNTGEKDWSGYELQAKLLSSDETNTNAVADDSWKSGSVVKKSQEIISKGNALREKFTFRLPPKKGEYEVVFALDGIKKSEARVKVHVTKDAPSGYALPHKAGDEQDITVEEYRLKEEPRIRVGLVTEGKKVQFISYDDDYTIFDGETKVGVLPRKHIGLVWMDNGLYHFKGGGEKIETTSYIRLEPVSDDHAVFEVDGLKDRRMAWVGPSDFTRYRGAFEYRQGEKDKELYVVNDLLLEDYVAGISETGRTAPDEFVKANIVAARNYAYISQGKYPFFDVLGSTYDQLYLGADVEKYLPKVPVAARETRGQMVTYNDEVVTTPYFGNSNGSTRSWTAVWGGSNKPWLVPVVANYDAGRRQFGHGVGMSQRDAALRAEKEGATWDELLAYYYSGTQLTKMYQ